VTELDPCSYDIPFHVPQVHRLRFTRQVLGTDGIVLTDLMQTSGNQPARVQVWIDSDLIASVSGICDRVTRIIGRVPQQLQLVEPPQAIAGGESCKNDPSVIDCLLEHFHRHDLDRRSYIVAIGGGAMLDAVGFAASVAHRGIRLVRLPTTTLAQADSGVGVKTAVNWFGKKNWKGTFCTPWGVINDQELLTTLSDRDWCCGFAESAKVTALKAPKTFQRLARTAKQIAARQPDAAAEMLRQSVLLHLRHITEGGDPFEALEARPLDFGHWSAHRLESLSNFRLRHGEAVAIGLAIDCTYSHLKLGFPADKHRQMLQTLQDLNLPISDPLLADPTSLLCGLEEFRQHLGGQLTVTMLTDLGKPIDVHEIDLAVMRQAISLMHQLHLTASTSMR
jgi:3-dehydroquinate synthase